MGLYELELKINAIKRSVANICCKVKCCLGIDATTGNSSLVLSQTGEWINNSTASGTAGEIAYFSDTDSVISSTNLFYDVINSTFEIYSGLKLRVTAKPYGINFSLNPRDYHYIITTSTGSFSINLTTITEIGSIFIISDLDRISNISNITLDSGLGNTIVSVVSSARTLIINTAGRSVTIQLVGTGKWIVI